MHGEVQRQMRCPKSPFGSVRRRVGHGNWDIALRLNSIRTAVRALAFAGLVTIHAGEQVPTQLPPQNDQITAAKRQLDDLKTTASNANSDSAAGPHISVPEFHAESAAPTPTPTLTEEQRKAVEKQAEKQSANWLVDAMMNPKSGAKTDRQRDLLGARRQRDDDLLGSARSNSDKSADRGDPRTDEKSTEDSDREKTKPSDTFNPLAQYMSGWLSPGDYGVLKHTIETGTSSSESGTGPAANSPVMSSSEFANAFAGLGLDSGASDKGVSDFTRPPPENPYLQALTGPEPSRLNLAPPAVPFEAAPTPATVYIPPAAPAQDPTKSKLPDFVKPLDDDKYFKPLKRF